ncbi:hypothetical protein GE061_015859 [Apolygus lucorum]|uniref:Uncharacterized protein n=1 Tax=Apolygus lucorum TaxID=248454 RepID=A0A8S9XMD8_APOLU|nr:hypothetical protein GE061_015859 [Apolygus lucorum]
MFLQRLPANVRAILASSSDPLDTLASMADRILEFSPSHSNAVYAVGSANTSDDRFSRLEAQVAQISEALAELKFRGRESSQALEVLPAINFRDALLFSLFSRTIVQQPLASLTG